MKSSTASGQEERKWRYVITIERPLFTNTHYLPELLPQAQLEQNWFSFFQCVGIVGGLLFTAFSLRDYTKSRRTSFLLSLAEQHRELWSEVHQQPELGRVLDPNANLVARPMTGAEREFVNLAIVHFNTGWLLSRETSLLSRQGMRGDVRSFFSLPLVKAVWTERRDTRDPQFVRFVNRCLLSK